MSASIEALAMAGVSYLEWPIDFGENEDNLPPPHLLADVEDHEDDQEQKVIVQYSSKTACWKEDHENDQEQKVIVQYCSKTTCWKRITRMIRNKKLSSNVLQRLHAGKKEPSLKF